MWHSEVVAVHRTSVPAVNERGSDSSSFAWVGRTVDRVSDRLDGLQRRMPPVAVAHGVLKKFGEDRGGQLAMLLTYRGFFAVFPLLLAFVNVVGLVLQGNSELRTDLIDSTLASIPVIGAQIRAGADDLGGSVFVIVVSVIVSLWAGLGLLEMIQESLNTIWGVPMFERPNWLIRRLRSLPGAAVMLTCLVLTGTPAWLFRWAPDPVRAVAGVAVPFLAGALCFVGLHLVLCHRRVGLTQLLPGAALVGTSWLALQLLGTWFVDRYVVRSSDTYGVFVLFFGLLSWTYLVSMFYLYGAELSAVLTDSRWPRSLTGRNLSDEDRATFRQVAEREVRVRGTDITVDVPRQPAAPSSD